MSKASRQVSLPTRLFMVSNAEAMKKQGATRRAGGRAVSAGLCDRQNQKAAKDRSAHSGGAGEKPVRCPIRTGSLEKAAEHASDGQHETARQEHACTSARLSFRSFRTSLRGMVMKGLHPRNMQPVAPLEGEARAKRTFKWRAPNKAGEHKCLRPWDELNWRASGLSVDSDLRELTPKQRSPRTASTSRWTLPSRSSQRCGAAERARRAARGSCASRPHASQRGEAGEQIVVRPCRQRC